MRYIFYIVTLLLITSCKNKENKFPFDEEQMVKEKLYGELLEYALFDSTKIDFVDSLLCDTLRKNEDLILSKIQTVINDSSYYFFHLHEYEPIINDYIGMIYMDINRFDSIYMYAFDNNLKYSTDEFLKVIEAISDHNKTTIEETIKYRKIKNSFIPNFYFVVMIDTVLCESGFVRKFKQINKQIDTMLNSCGEHIFKNEKINIDPYIEITGIYTEIYKSRYINRPPPIPEEDLFKVGE